MATKEVLLVDDEQDVRDLISEFLNEQGIDMNITTATSGNEAFQIVKAKHFDLLVTDLQMPNGDGHQLLSNIKKLPINARPKNVLVLSAFIDPTMPFNTVLPVSYMSKPFAYAALEKYVKIILGFDDLMEQDKKDEKIDNKHGAQLNALNAFCEVSMRMMKMLCDLDLKREETTMLNGPSEKADISAMMNISGKKEQWMFRLAFSKGAFLDIINRILSTSHQEISQENADAAGELLDQIFAMGKMALNMAPEEMQRGIPTITVGSHTFAHLSSASAVTCNLATPSGKINLSILAQSAD